MRTHLVALAALIGAFPGFAQAAIWIDPDVARVMESGPRNLSLDVIIVMEEQLDARALADQVGARGGRLADRHRIVVEEARALSARSQAPLLEELRAAQRSGDVSRIRPFWIMNAIALTARPDYIAELARRPDIRSIYMDVGIELIAPIGEARRASAAASIENAVLQTGAPELWALGIDGSTSLACDQDTGADGSHIAFADRWRGLEPGVEPGEAWFDPIYGETFPTDSDIHGTHTLGTMVGDDGQGNQIGMAPGAKWIGAKTIDVPGGDIFSDAVAAFEWAADPDGDPTTMDDVPDVVNNSWGLSQSYYGSCRDDFNAAIDVVEAAGVVVIFAAGNEGSDGLRSPGNRIASEFNTFAVGALNQDNETIAYFSSLGPSDCDDATIKPEITAIGVDVYSSFPGDTYGYLSGTSMATPVISGAVLLLRDAYPEATVDEIKQALYVTAEDLGAPGEDNVYGMGRVDVVAAYYWLEDYFINSDGKVSIGSVFSCDDVVEIELTDIDLTEASIDVTISSGTEPLGEVVTLTESTRSGRYTGSIPTTSAAASSADGVLSLSDGDVIQVDYLDADDGEGHVDVLKSDTALADCGAPLFGGLVSADAGDYQVALAWEEGSDPNSVSYRVYRATSSGSYDFASPLATTSGTSYVDEDVQNGTTYYYVVHAVDGVGNVNASAVELSATPVGPDRLLRQQFDEGTFGDWTVVNGGRCQASWRLASCPSNTWCSGEMAYVDHDDCRPRLRMDEALVSPALSAQGYEGVAIRFDHEFDQGGPEKGDLDYSLDGSSWTNLVSYSRDDASGSVEIAVPELDGAPQFFIRFHYSGTSPLSDDWSVDNVEVVAWPLAE